MTELITYRGGSNGDFMRMLIKNELHEISNTGKVSSNKFNDFTRPLFNLIYTDDINDLVKKATKLKENGIGDTDVITSHDIYAFIERYNSAKEFFEYIEKIGIQRVLYISVTTETSIKIRTINAKIKNEGCTLDEALSFFNKYGVHQLKQYQEENEIFIDTKRYCDIILELEYIYDKEYLRDFLKNHYKDWEDKNYDMLYDTYMSVQPKYNLNT